MATRRSLILGDATCRAYDVYDLSVGGEIRRVAKISASSYLEALKEAREHLPNGLGELRENGRVICRFGRAKPFMLRI